MIDYAKNNYNAGKTLRENGYKESVALAKSGQVLGTAERIVRENLNLDTKDMKETSQTLLDIVGVSREDVLKEYLKVILQDRDLTNKLKAMSPLLKELSIRLDDVETKITPSINITVKEKDKTPNIKDIETVNIVS